MYLFHLKLLLNTPTKKSKFIEAKHKNTFKNDCENNLLSLLIYLQLYRSRIQNSLIDLFPLF